MRPLKVELIFAEPGPEADAAEAALGRVLLDWAERVMKERGEL